MIQSIFKGNSSFPVYIDVMNKKYNTDRITNDNNDVKTTLLLQALNALRQKLLDLTTRNRLLNYKVSMRSIPIIENNPNDIFNILLENKNLEFLPVDENHNNEDGEDVHGQLNFFDDNQNKENYDIKLRGTKNHARATSVSDKNSSIPYQIKSSTRLQTQLPSEILEKRCKKLLNESRTAIEETGSNLLHLAMGFLEWYDDDSSSEVYRAPLILVPIQIEKARLDKKTNCYNYVISYTGEDIETNLSLVEKLKEDFDLILPSLDEETVPETYFSEVKRTINKKARWKVSSNIVLGMFSFAKILMYKDLDNALWPDEEKLINNENCRQILIGKEIEGGSEQLIYEEEYLIDKDPKLLNLPLVWDADSSQHSALIDAIQYKKSIVIEGPPGTGKSQTITNLIAAALCEGLSVLFVAEKKAALDVVKARLDKVDLGNFCLELHSHKTQKGQMHANLAKRLGLRFKDPSILDSEINELVSRKEQLQAITTVLNQKVGPYEERIYEIFWAAERWSGESPKLKARFSIQNPLLLSREHIENSIIVLNDIAKLRAEIPDKAINAWKGFIPQNMLPGDEEILRDVLSSLSEAIENVLTVFETNKHLKDMVTKPNLECLFQLADASLDLIDKKPYEFDVNVASTFLDKENVDLLSAIVQTIDEYNELVKKAESVLGKLKFHSVEQIQSLFKSTQSLSEMGYGHLEPANLKTVIDAFSATQQHIAELKGLVMLACDCFAEPPSTINDSLRLIKIAEILEESPVDLIIHGHPENILEIAPSLFNAARLECAELQKELSVLLNIIDVSALTKHNELHEIIVVLKKNRNSLFSFLNKDYRIARKKVKNYLTDKKHLKSKDLIDNLEKMVNTAKKIENVLTYQHYKKFLGPVFRGLDTDWEHLNSIITWCQNFREAVGSQKHAMSMLTNILDVKESAVVAGKKAKESWKKISDELEKINISIKTDIDFETQLGLLSELKQTLEDSVRQFSSFKELENVEIDLLNKSYCSLILATNIEDSINNNNGFKEAFGHYFNGVKTDIASLSNIADWVVGLQNQSRLPAEYIHFVVKTASTNTVQLLTQLSNYCSDFTICYKNFFDVKLSSMGTLNKDEFLVDKEPGPYILKTKLVECIDNIEYLVKMSDYFSSLDKSKSLGIETMAEQISERMLGPDDCESFYRSTLYESIARELIKKHSELGSFTRTNYENIVHRFVELDKKIMKRTTERIAYNLSQKSIPHGISSGRKAEYTQLSLISHEISKKKRHIPIRQLVKRAGYALQALKPCFMMSPLSVAQYLAPGNIKFDVVVMDEASQIRPADALGAIARTGQIVIVGDPNQLPPTSFFERIGGEDYDEETTAVTDAESILDICLSSYMKRRLRWHYRSEHESLIAFSNSKFYDNDLIIFPSPYEKNNSYGIRYHYVEGAKYYKGRNPKEAEVIANAIAEHFSSHPKESLGVATFNKEQSDLIADILESMQKKQAWLERALKLNEQSDEPFFIKNLENVQGDERDVIFISTTYGPDQETGHVFQRFGPLTGETGWRRLNVIITRAKRRVEVFTSMKSTDIKLTPGSKRGVDALKTYLEYAEKGILADYGEITITKEPDSDFEIAVSKVLKSHGYESVPQVGVAGFFIDIGVKHPHRFGEYLLGIECDGASYHSAKSIRDRDRLRQDILEKKGWIIHRIWSTDWFKNRESESQRLLNALDDLIKKEKQTTEIIKKEKVAAYPQIDTKENEEGEEDEEEREFQKPDFWGHSSRVDRKKALFFKELQLYNEKNILPSFPDITNGILRNEMIDYFVKGMPITKNDFFSVIPLQLRQKTDPKQLVFLEDIFEIIESYIFS